MRWRCRRCRARDRHASPRQNRALPASQAPKMHRPPAPCPALCRAAGRQWLSPAAQSTQQALVNNPSPATPEPSPVSSTRPHIAHRRLLVQPQKRRILCFSPESLRETAQLKPHTEAGRERPCRAVGLGEDDSASTTRESIEQSSKTSRKQIHKTKNRRYLRPLWFSLCMGDLLACHCAESRGTAAARR